MKETGDGDDSERKEMVIWNHIPLLSPLGLAGDGSESGSYQVKEACLTFPLPEENLMIVLYSRVTKENP